MKRLEISKIRTESMETLKNIKRGSFLLGFIPTVLRIIISCVEFLIRDLCRIPYLIDGKINLSGYSLVLSLLFMFCRWLLVSPVSTAWLRSMSVGDGKGRLSEILFYYYSSFSALFGCLFFNLKFVFLLISFVSVCVAPSLTMFVINSNSNPIINLIGIFLAFGGILLFILLSSVDLWYLWEFLKGNKKPFGRTKKAVKGKFSQLFLLNLTFLPFGFLWLLVIPRIYILPRLLTCFKAVDKGNNHQ